MDLVAHRVWREGRDVHLTPLEFELLALLIKHEGRVVTHQELLGTIWGQDCVRRIEYLRVYIRSLRHKLSLTASDRGLLVTEPKVGYRLQRERPPARRATLPDMSQRAAAHGDGPASSHSVRSR